MNKPFSETNLDDVIRSEMRINKVYDIKRCSERCIDIHGGAVLVSVLHRNGANMAENDQQARDYLKSIVKINNLPVAGTMDSRYPQIPVYINAQCEYCDSCGCFIRIAQTTASVKHKCNSCYQ